MLYATFSGISIYGQTIEKSRTVTETFKLGPDTEIEIANKYGNIHLIPWEKDSIRFDIELMVRGTKQSKVDKSFDYIEFDFKTTKYYIIAQTLFAGNNSFWSDVSDLTGAIFNSSTKTKIDYTVYLPAGAKLKISNKYGNIYTTDHSGNIEIALSNGDLKAHSFSGKAKIKSEFGNVNIKQIADGNLKISYGELHLEQAGRVIIESKSSKFYLDNIANMEIDSRRDKFYIKHIGYIHGLTNFTTVEIESLDEKLKMTTKYGDIDVQQFSDDVELFDLKADDTDVTLHFIDAKQYKLDVLVTDRTEVMYSSGIKNISSKELDNEENQIKVDCVIGSDASRTVPIRIDSHAGRLSLKLK